MHRDVSDPARAGPGANLNLESSHVDGDRLGIRYRPGARRACQCTRAVAIIARAVATITRGNHLWPGPPRPVATRTGIFAFGPWQLYFQVILVTGNFYIILKDSGLCLVLVIGN